MSKNEINVEELPMLNVGIVGHIDHGKTTLLSKLTGKFADTHSEELKRGITIKLGYADLILEKSGKPARYISFVDAPGHEMLMATMLSGAALIDAAILLVAANEGIKPQTREHLTALQMKGIKNIIIVQNKIDLVTKEQAEKNYKDIKEFVKATVAESAPIIPVSVLQDINLDKINELLLEFPIPERDTKSHPLFLVARSFDINKPGTKAKDLHGGVLAGVLKQGILNLGDEIEIKPGLYEKRANQMIYETIKTKIVSIYRGSHSIKQATPGGSLSIETELDNILTKTDSLSGCVASPIGNLPEIQDTVNIKFQVLPKIMGLEKETKAQPLAAGELIMLNINTAITVGKIKRIKNDTAEINLRIPVVPIKGANVGLARNIDSHWRLIGFGTII